MAWLGQLLPSAGELVLRMGRHEAAEDADVVRTRRGATAVRLRRNLDDVDQAYAGPSRRPSTASTSSTAS